MNRVNFRQITLSVRLMDFDRNKSRKIDFLCVFFIIQIIKKKIVIFRRKKLCYVDFCWNEMLGHQKNQFHLWKIIFNSKKRIHSGVVFVPIESTIKQYQKVHFEQ